MCDLAVTPGFNHTNARREPMSIQALNSLFLVLAYTFPAFPTSTTQHCLTWLWEDEQPDLAQNNLCPCYNSTT